MVRCKLKLNTRLERKKGLRGKPPVLDLENLAKNRQKIDIDLSNRSKPWKRLKIKMSIAERRY